MADKNEKNPDSEVLSKNYGHGVSSQTHSVNSMAVIQTTVIGEVCYLRGKGEATSGGFWGGGVSVVFYLGALSHTWIR